MTSKKLWLLIVLTWMISIVGCQKKENNLVQFVNPLIGTGKSTAANVTDQTFGPESWGQVIPAVSTPFGMTQWTPQTNDSEHNGVAPYYYNGKRIQGFRGSHWLGGSCGKDYGSFTIMPMTGYLRTFASERASIFTHESETSSPAYYSCMLEAYTTFVEMTGTARSGFFRFSYLKNEQAIIWVTPNSDEGKGFLKIDPERREIVGYNPVHHLDRKPGEPAGFCGYFVIRFNQALSNYGCSFQMEDHKGETEISGMPDIGAYAAFDLAANDVILAKVGTSFTGIEAARANLDAEIPHWEFDKTRAETESTWNKTLSTIQLKGGRTEDYTRFYTAMYHALLFPRTFSDVDGTYLVLDGQPSGGKMGKGRVYYDDFLLEQIHKAQLPLVSLVAPERYEDMIKSLSGEPTLQHRRLVALADSALSGLVADSKQIRQKLEGLFNSGSYRQDSVWSDRLPYLYNFIGDPVETQRKVKGILANDYNNYEGGIPGNDHGGQTSAWYVFSAMGFYPFSTDNGQYQLSSPIFSEVTLNLNPKYYPGKELKIITDQNDTSGTFNTVKLNDKNINFVLTQEEIRAGGKLEFSNANR